jgi:UDPglucose--hexose-1-phosphate uridylyltransferase
LGADSYQGTLLADPEKATSLQEDLYRVEGDRGTSRVTCFSPRHDLTLAEMSRPEIESVVAVWTEQYQDLSQKDYIGYVQIFENKGAVMGCSAPHPHGQIWATAEVPTEPAKELAVFGKYKEKHSRCLLCDYLESEIKGNKSRIVCENDSFVAMVPFWAVWWADFDGSRGHIKLTPRPGHTKQ